MSSHHLTRDLGDRRKLPQRGPGQSPGSKMDFLHISGQKEAIWNTLFSIFERWRGPPNVVGPGKTSPPFPSLSTGLFMVTHLYLTNISHTANHTLQTFSHSIVSPMHQSTSPLAALHNVPQQTDMEFIFAQCGANRSCRCRSPQVRTQLPSCYVLHSGKLHCGV